MTDSEERDTPPAEQRYLALLGCLAVLGSLLVWVATVGGAGLTPDSVAYLRMVRGLLAGDFIAETGTHFPPGYPWLWSGTLLFARDEFQAARLLCSLSMGMALMGFGLCLRRAAKPEHATLMLTVILLLLLNPGFSSQFLFALSEAPMLAFLAWSCYFALALAQDNRPIHWFALFACLVVLMLLRYASAPLVGAILLWLAWQRRGVSVSTLLLAGLGTAVAMLPLLVWLGLSTQVGEASAARELHFHPPGLVKWEELLSTLSGWLGFGHTFRYLALPVFLAPLAVALWRPESRHKPVVQLALLIGVAYLAFLLLSLSLFDAYTPLDERILSPMLPLWLIIVTALANGVRVRNGLALALLGVLLLNLGSEINFIRRSISQGLGFAAVDFKDAPAFRLAAQVPEDRPIYTNAWEFFYLHHNRETRQLPRYFDPKTEQMNPTFAEEWQQLIEAMREEDAFIVWSPYMAGRTYLPSEEDLIGSGMLQISAQLEGGTLFTLKPEQPSVD